MRPERSDFELHQGREGILVFAPTTTNFECLQRGGALEALARTFEVACVVPPGAARAPPTPTAAIFTGIRRFELQLDAERLRLWSAAFRPTRLAVPPAQRRRLLQLVRTVLTLPMIDKARRRGLLRLAQASMPPLRLRRLLLAAASLDLDEFFARRWARSAARRGRGGARSGPPPPMGAICDIIDRTRPLLAMLLTDFRDAWFPDVLWACEARGMPCVVVEGAWRARGEVRGMPPVLWCRKGGFVETCASELTSDAMTARRGLHASAAVPKGYGKRLVKLAAEVAAPYARRARRARMARQRTHISNAYGADGVARAYAAAADRADVPGYWMHGWLPAHHNIDPALIAQHKRPGQGPRHDYEGQIRAEKREVPQWVSREDQAAYLASHGYRKVRAIGLPLIYLPPVRVRRVPGSLLVMPPHGHESHGPGDPIADAYAEAIADVRGRFGHVAVCLSREDLEAEQWAWAFRRRGFEVFSAVDPYRPDALQQLKRLLSAFEFVTTNGFGSHIAYAAYCGARVSVFGPFAEIPLERMAKTHAVRMFPELLDRSWTLCREGTLLRRYRFLFADPDRADVRADWGAQEVGEDCKVAPAELGRLFGWTVSTPDLEAGVAMGRW